jgi:ABC-2 type transport system permease protein
VSGALGKACYLAALARINLGAALARPGFAATAALMMFANNLILFLVWAIYFANFSSLKGWGREDMALLIGIFAWAFGCAMLIAAGVRDLAQTIVDGGLDLHLGRPRHPLSSLLLSRSAPSGLGDLASALVFWLWLAGRGMAELPLLILVASAAAIVLVATTAIAQSIVFWSPRVLPLCEELFNTFLMVSFYPQHPYGFTVRLALFTVFPTALVTLLPAEVVRTRSLLMALALLAAAIVYSGLAALVFGRGLRRYASGNRMLELR